MESEQQRVMEAMHRAKRKRASLKREMELFGMMLFGVIFGILSSMAASYADNVVRGSLVYPGWYSLALFIAFGATIVVLGAIYLALRRERKDVDLMEQRFQEVLSETRR